MCNLYEIYKYRIIIQIIIIISLCQILLSYIANTSLAHTHTPTHRRRRSGCRCSMDRWRPTMMELRQGSTPDQKNYGQCSIFDSWSANNAYIYMKFSANLVYILLVRTVNFFSPIRHLHMPNLHIQTVKHVYANELYIWQAQ